MTIRLIVSIMALLAMFATFTLLEPQTASADVLCCIDPPIDPDPLPCDCHPVDPPVEDEEPARDDDHDEGDTGYTPPVIEPPRLIGVCHATGSPSNPFVHIVVEESAVPAHRSHPGDIIGVNAPDQCPQVILPTPTPVIPAIGICHATGNVNNPYVHIMVEHKDRPQHDSHGKDIVGVSNPNDCPQPIVVVEPPVITPTPPVVVPEPPVVVTPSPAPVIDIPPVQNAPTSVEQLTSAPVTSVAIPDKVQAPQAATMPAQLPKAGEGWAIQAWWVGIMGLLGIGVMLVLCGIIGLLVTHKKY